MALLFTDISRSTALASAMEPEDYADLLTAIRGCLQQVMDRFAGKVLRVDGDGALCMFGHDGPMEHAGKSAAMAALAFHAEVTHMTRSRGQGAIDLHSGIHAGLVLLRQGDLVRGRYEVLGDATNVAARLCDAASAGEILISDEALGGDGPVFELAARRGVILPDGERRILAHPVLGLQSHNANGTLGPHHPTIGREHELYVAQQWLQQPAEDAPVLYIQAEAGGGKSRLLSAIIPMAKARGLRVARGQCEEDVWSAPLQPILPLINDLGAMPKGEADIWDMADTIKSAILISARAHPLLLVIDDWQWADDATKRLVEQSMALAKGRLRLAVASRDYDGGLQGCLPQWTLDLSPLTKEATHALVAQLAPHFDPQRVRKIHALSGGNPLLVEELCRDPDLSLARASDTKVSFRVAAVVERRLAEISPRLIQLLDYIAIYGGPMPLATLVQLSGPDAMDMPTLRNLPSSVDFIQLDEHGGESLRFRHTLLRQAVYNRLAPQQRRNGHRTIADHLLAQGTLPNDGSIRGQLAYHLLACNDQRGLDYALDAGKMAMYAGAVDRALGQYRRAIDFIHAHREARDEVTTVRLANRFGSAVLLDPHAEHFAALGQLRAIAQQQGMGAVLGRLHYWQASLHYATGRPDAAFAVLNQPDFVVEFTQSGLSHQLLTGLKGQLCVLMGKHKQATQHFDEAIAGLQGVGNPAYDDSLSYMMLMRAQARGEQGFFAGATRDFERAERLLQGRDAPLYASILVQKAGVALWREDYGEVRRLAADGLQLGDRIGSRYYAMLSRALDAVARGALSPDADALAELEHCVRWSTHTQSGFTLSLVQSWAADLALRIGDRARAMDYSSRCIAQGRHRLYWGAVSAWRVRAELAETRAEADRALRYSYVHARRMGSLREWAATMMTHSVILSRFGEDSRAADLIMGANHLRALMGLATFAPAYPERFAEHEQQTAVSA